MSMSIFISGAFSWSMPFASRMFMTTLRIQRNRCLCWMWQVKNYFVSDWCRWLCSYKNGFSNQWMNHVKWSRSSEAMGTRLLEDSNVKKHLKKCKIFSYYLSSLLLYWFKLSGIVGSFVSLVAEKDKSWLLLLWWYITKGRDLVPLGILILSSKLWEGDPFKWDWFLWLISYLLWKSDV